MRATDKRTIRGVSKKLTAEMKNAIACVDVREETVPQTLPLGSSFHQPGDVYYVQESWNLAEINAVKIFPV